MRPATLLDEHAVPEEQAEVDFVGSVKTMKSF